MTTLPIIISGVVATLAMTFFMNTCAMITGSNMYTVKILSRMLPTLLWPKQAKEPVLSRAMAIAIHYGIGILFVVVYHLLRTSEGYVGNQSMAEPWIIGIVLGTTAVAGWTIFIRLHPSPLLTVPWQYYLLCIFAAHIIFAFAMIYCYQWFIPVPGMPKMP